MIWVEDGGNDNLPIMNCDIVGAGSSETLRGAAPPPPPRNSSRSKDSPRVSQRWATRPWGRRGGEEEGRRRGGGGGEEEEGRRRGGGGEGCDTGATCEAAMLGGGVAVFPAMGIMGCIFNL